MHPQLFAVSLSLPDRALSPNVRVHWRRKAVAVRAYRQEAFLAALAAGARDHVTLRPPITVVASYTFRMERRRDDDNLIAMLKPAIDGLVDAGILADDSGRHLHWARVRVQIASRQGVQLLLHEDGWAD